MTDRKTPQETELDMLLEEACTRDTDVPSALMHRVIQDAQAEQTLFKTQKAWQNRLAEWLRDHFGGWGVLGGMVATGCVGFWIGFNPPVALDGLDLPVYAPGSVALGGEAAELSGFGWDLEETDT